LVGFDPRLTRDPVQLSNLTRHDRIVKVDMEADEIEKNYLNFSDGMGR